MNEVTISGDPLLQKKPFHVAVNGQRIEFGEKDRLIVDTTGGDFGCRVTISFFARVVKADITDKALKELGDKAGFQLRRGQFYEVGRELHNKMIDQEMPYVNPSLSDT